MTAAFTSDAKSRWAAEWMTWEGFGKFWTQVIRQTMRNSDARGISINATRVMKLASAEEKVSWSLPLWPYLCAALEILLLFDFSLHWPFNQSEAEASTRPQVTKKKPANHRNDMQG